MDPFWAGLVALVPVGSALLYGRVLGVGVALVLLLALVGLLPRGIPGVLLWLLRGAFLKFRAPPVVQLVLRRPFYIKKIF